MSTSFRGGYTRGINAPHLEEDDGVDAASVSDLLVGNAQHLFDAHHSHIANVVTLTGESPAIRQTEPSALFYVCAYRVPFVPIEQEDGGSATVVYRIRFHRTGGSGSITIGVRIGYTGEGVYMPTSAGSVRQAEHTTSSTTAETVRGTLYVPPASFDLRHPLIENGTGAQERTAWFEVWCIYTGSKPTVSLPSVMARQYVRTGGVGGGYELREDGGYELREDGSRELRE